MNLERFLTTGTVLLDGAMGTQLAAAGLDMGGPNNITHPEVVQDIHKRYADSGCDLLITNTLTMNRIYIETHALEVDVREVNLAGAKLARSATGPGQYVLGDMSSTGQMLEPYGVYTEEQMFDAFQEQAELLAQGGVDGFIIETMMDLREALCAVRACQAVGPLPVLASLSFQTADHGGRTIMGDAAGESATALVAAGASAVGANCGDLDPFQMATLIASMKRAVSVPLLAQPNAGRPRLVQGRTEFSMGPEDFAAGIAACLESGARLVGGCCGTTPAHIRRVAELLGRARDDPSPHLPPGGSPPGPD